MTGISAGELVIDPAGKSSYSGRFTGVDGCIQNGPPSAVEIERTGQALKITLTSRREAGWKPVIAGEKDDDTDMFNGETAEVFLMPENSPDYFQFAVNPNGCMYSARNRDFSWEPSLPVQRKVHIGPDRWVAQFVIPFAAISAQVPGKGTVWRANFALSTFRGSLRKQTSWSGAVSFHEPREFGKLIFGGEEKIRIKSWNVRNNALHADIFIPEKLRKKVAIVCGVDGRRFAVAKPQFTIPLSGRELNPKGMSAVEFLVDLRVESSKKCLFQQRQTAAYPVAGNFTLNRFYSTPLTRDVQYQCDLEAPVEMRLFRHGKVIKTISNIPANGSVPLDGITPGRLTVEVKSLKSQIFARRLLIICGKELTPEPLTPGGPSIDGSRLRIGGKPVFFISGGSAAIRAHHAREVFNFDTANYGIMKNAAVLRRFPYVSLIRKPTVGYVYHNNWREMIDKAVAAAPKEQMFRISYEAQLDIYFKKDGKLERHDSAPFIKGVYDYVKNKYPERILTLQCDRSSVLANYKDSCDILEGAFWSSSYAESVFPNMQSDMKTLRELAGGKPAIYWLGVSIPKAEVRIAEEVRAGVYAAVFHDMAGVVFHMGHAGVPRERGRLWSVVSGINAEISQWYPGYALGKKLDNFITGVEGPFVTRAWITPEGKMYVGAVNLSTGRQQLYLKCKKGIIKDEFIAGDAKIYQLR